MDRATMLHRYLAVAQGFTLDPGQFDCALFVAGWVDTLRGTALTERYIGSYASFAEGRRLLKADGIRSLRDLASRELEPVSGWMAAQPGDVALIREARALAFGIVGSGGHIHVVAQGRGLDTVRLMRAEEVFRP